MAATVQVPELCSEATPNSMSADVKTSQNKKMMVENQPNSNMKYNQGTDEEPEVDSRCDVRMQPPMHRPKQEIPMPVWGHSQEESPLSSIKPRLTLSAFRKPATTITQCDSSRILEDVYDLNRPGCSGVLGHGAFSTVRLALRRSDSVPVAIKSIAKHEALRSRRLRVGRFLEEWEILQKMKGHDFIIQLLDIFETEEEIQLVLEFCEGGELFNAIQRKRNRSQSLRRGQYSEDQAACITTQILRALNDLHAMGVAHRDVKPENILLLNSDENSVRVKLCDFGLARSLQPYQEEEEQQQHHGEDGKEGNISPVTPGRMRSNSVIGSSYYVAPELSDGTYDTAVDIYSLGVTLYILLCGFPPIFAGAEADKVVFPTAYWKDISEEAKQLVRKMLNNDASARITAHEALRDTWIWKHRDVITHELRKDAAKSSLKSLSCRNKINLDLVRRRLSNSLDRNRKRRRLAPPASASEKHHHILLSPKRAKVNANGTASNASASSALMALADLYRDVAQSPSAKVISSVVEHNPADPVFRRSPLPTLSV